MRQLVLTFDNGPNPSTTELVLETLASHDCDAIFLPIGRKLESPQGQEWLAHIAEAGHLIGNHTYSHPRPFGKLPPHEAIEEITNTQQLLGDFASSQRFFRPSAGGGVLGPGVLNHAVVEHLLADNYTLLVWDLVCEDWCRADGTWVDIALEGIGADGPTVLVLHDIDGGAMAHLDRFLDRVFDAGIDVVSQLPHAATPILQGELIASVDHLLPAGGTDR